MRPRLLDLFCGAGGCSVGYHRAGFDVVGVDIEPQPNYPFEFRRDDALGWLDWLGDGIGDYDAIHASPPCQTYLNLTRVNEAMGRSHGHQNLIDATRERLHQTGLPYVIENVSDARPHLVDPLQLCGSSFGLAVRRHRLFESNVPMMMPPCAHHLQREPRYWTAWRPNGEERKASVVQVYGNGANREEWGPAMGIDWMTPDELAEAIPPAYTEHIGHYLLAEIKARQAA